MQIFVSVHLRKLQELKKEDKECGNKESIMDTQNALMAVVEEKIQPVVWNKLYKREVVEDLWFEVGKYNEDEFLHTKQLNVRIK